MANEKTNIAVVEETTEKAKVYTFRQLGAQDMFPMLKIVKKVGLNKFTGCLSSSGVQSLITKLQDNKEDMTSMEMLVGGGVLLEVAQVLIEGLADCEAEIFDLLERVSNLSLEEIKALDMVTFTEMIIDFIKKDEFMDFIKAVSKLVK